MKGFVTKGLRQATAEPLEDHLARLLQSAAELVGVRIEIWNGQPDAIYAQEPCLRCDECRRNSPDHSRACRQRRGDSRRAILEDSGATRWLCPHGCEVSILPLRAAAEPGTRMVAVRPSAHPLDPCGKPTEIRFLAQLAELMADHLVVCRELGQVEQELASRRAELRLFYSVSGKITNGEDMREAIRLILEQARRAVGAAAAFVSIPTRRMFETAVGEEAGSHLGIRALHDLAVAVEAHLGDERRCVYAGSAGVLGISDAALGRSSQILAVSLGKDGRSVGVLGLLRLIPLAHPRVGDLHLLESLSERIVMATANSDMVDDFKEFLMATVRSLVSAIEAKDSYTSGHSARVNLLSMLIGKKLGLDGEDLEILRWASILHDVGKIGMPESILKKPGRLTPDEYEIMKTHPERGYQVLSPIRQLSAASQAVRAHHEWYDGNGYPMGLKGEEIPLRARIIAVADTYDALTSTRSYRTRRSPDAAFEVIREAKGTQLDPRVVEVLGDLIPFIREHEVMLRGGPVEPDQEVEDEATEAMEAREAA